MGKFLRPIIPVEVKHKKKAVKYLTLIDSGADFNIFHAGVAEILDIDYKEVKKQKLSGISGKSSFFFGYPIATTLAIDNYFFDTIVFFSEEISDNGFGILGQEGFFNHFKISFDYSRKRVFIRK